MEKSKVFSDWLTLKLQELSMSAGELAERARISRSAMYFYKDGHRLPSPEVVIKICLALGTPLSTVPEFTRPKKGRQPGWKPAVLQELTGQQDSGV